MSDCIESTIKPNAKGYCRTRYHGKQVYRHRLAFFEANCYWPNICRHTCDNKICYNADHLVDGTIADNNQDMVERGRYAVGSRFPQSKLTDPKVLEMRMLYASGMTQRRLATMFGVSASIASHVVTRYRWKHVGGQYRCMP